MKSLCLQVHTHVRERVEVIKGKERDKNQEGGQGPSGAGTSAATQKKARVNTDSDLFGFLMVKKSAFEDDELTKYLPMPASEVPEDMDLLTWWKVHVRYTIHYVEKHFVDLTIGDACNPTNKVIRRINDMCY